MILRLTFRAREGVVGVLVGAGGRKSPRDSSGVVGGKTLHLAIRAREVVLVGANHLRHSNREWEGGGWQGKPPTRSKREGANHLRHSERWLLLVG